jgi:excisionase family DNA binding protein
VNSIEVANFERLLGSDEAASLLDIHPKTLQRMARKGVIPAIRIGKLWRFRGSDLDKWINSAIASPGQSVREN